MRGKVIKKKLMNKNKQHIGLKMGSIKTRTAHSPDRYGQLDEEINTDQSHRLNRKTLTKSQLTVSEEKSSKNGRNMPKRPKIRSRHLKFN